MIKKLFIIYTALLCVGMAYGANKGFNVCPIIKGESACTTTYTWGVVGANYSTQSKHYCFVMLQNDGSHKWTYAEAAKKVYNYLETGYHASQTKIQQTKQQ